MSSSAASHECPNCPSNLAEVRECSVHGKEVYCEMCGTRTFCSLPTGYKKEYAP